MSNLKKCVIFAAGEINDLSFADVGNDAFVICADGGYKYAQKLNITPDIVIGDFDSSQKPEGDFSVISFPTRKDDTDLMLAIKYGLELDKNDFVIYGATGGRLDHTVAAFSALSYLYDNKAKAIIEDENCVIQMLGYGEHRVQSLGGYLSLFPYGCDCVAVKLEGFEFNGENLLLTSSFPLGVSNKIKNKYGKITVLSSEDESRLLMIRTKK